MLISMSGKTLELRSVNFLFRSLNFSVASSLYEPHGPFLSLFPFLSHHRLSSIPPSDNFSVWSPPVGTQPTSDQVFQIDCKVSYSIGRTFPLYLYLISIDRVLHSMSRTVPRSCYDSSTIPNCHKEPAWGFCSSLVLYGIRLLA